MEAKDMPWVVLALLTLLVANGATAQERSTRCAKHQDIVDKLATEFHQTLTFMGVTSGGTLMQLYASSESGTWTLVDLHGNGLACVMTAGDGFETKPVGELIKLAYEGGVP